jgi:hypothetical protein
MGLSILAAAVALATPQQFLLAHQLPNGSFAEQSGGSATTLTAWSLLALRSAHVAADDRYLRAHEDDLQTPTELALGVLAESHPSSLLISRLTSTPDDATVNGAIWKLLAFARLGRAPPPAAVTYVLRNQARNGGWSWAPQVAPDSNDTAVAIEALHATGVGERAVRRGIAYLRKLENRDGGFPLVPGRTSDAQSTAWVIQAFVAARATPPRLAFRYLARLRNRDGSYRYSRRYAVTPVWVTAQVLPALERRAFPLG